jgi:uncharacterized protein YcfJ
MAGKLDMNKPILISIVLGSLAATAVIGCRPVEPKSTSVATQAKPANVGHEECTDEIVTLARQPRDKDQLGGTAVGAVIGGVLGNQVGHGDGKKLATAAGAVAGGYAGNKIQENAQEKSTYQETRRTCRMVYDTK